jgi:glycosyltransferase involved in cell wall biosynthesis
MDNEIEHICVCICTYKRPQLLRRLLDELRKQVTGGLFTYSIVVVDNDHLQSAEVEVSDFAASSCIPIRYCAVSVQNIPMARNKAIDIATGNFVAFIDDDEFPTETWLLTLLKAYKQYCVDGVIGPVYAHFDEEPPKWIINGKFWQGPTYPTGLIIDGKKGRVSNALLKAEIFAVNKDPFRPEFRTGEDVDFFLRTIEEGHVFVWCNEAAVYEVVPPKRWKRSFILRRSLLQGSIAPLHRTFGAAHFAKSVIYVPVFVILLPFAAILGHHRFMIVLVKLVYHSGRILGRLGVQVVKDPYVTD